MEVKTVGLASDHAGYALKQFVIKFLNEKGYPLAEGMEKGEVYPGIAICGSGQGISMTLNKHPMIRAGVAWCEEIAHLIRQHNDANVLVMPGRFISEDTARQIMEAFFTVPFEGGRHQRRIDKIPLRKE